MLWPVFVPFRLKLSRAPAQKVFCRRVSLVTWENEIYTTVNALDFADEVNVKYVVSMFLTGKSHALTNLPTHLVINPALRFSV